MKKDPCHVARGKPAITAAGSKATFTIVSPCYYPGGLQPCWISCIHAGLGWSCFLCRKWQRDCHVLSPYVTYCYWLSASFISQEGRWTKWLNLKPCLLIVLWQPRKKYNLSHCFNRATRYGQKVYVFNSLISELSCFLCDIPSLNLHWGRILQGPNPLVEQRLCLQ